MAASQADEVLYEIRRHGNISVDTHKASNDSKGGLLSHLSLKGVRDKWNLYKKPRTTGRRTSLIVSPNGLYVAVAVYNRLFILHKEDDYKEPCGSFSCADAETVFTRGSWLESKAIIGIVDSQGTLYVIKANGEELTCKTKKQLKLEAQITELVLLDDIKSKDSFLCSFCIFTSDASILYGEVTQELDIYVKTSFAPSSHLKKAQLPHEVSCVDVHAELSLAVLVGNSYKSNGTYFLHIVHLTPKSEALLLLSHECEGSFAYSKVQTSSSISPKVAISPEGKYVATLDSSGCVDIFKIGDEQRSPTLLSPAAEVGKAFDVTPEKKKFFYDIIDISWWTDNILVVAHRTGQITMSDILTGLEVSRNNPILFMPIIEGVNHHSGCVFILEHLSSMDNKPVSGNNKSIQQLNSVAGESSWQDTGIISCCLISLSQSSVSKMYKVLIKNQEYQAALDFASKHGFDTDEVLKAQWLHSGQGNREINLYLSQIKDLSFVLSECLRVRSSEETVRALFSLGLYLTEKHKISDLDDGDGSLIWHVQMFRLQLLQCRDRLETFIGINMGRFSELEYSKFCSIPLHEAAVGLAESGKIGALNLLFKRHPFSISSHILHILAAIPETVAVQSYCQLLPGKSPPTSIALREDDWVESKATLNFINKSLSNFENVDLVRTENILKLSTGFIWPSVTELADWYTKRAQEIDNLSGQLDNCLSLVEFACQNGIDELQHLREDISYLNQLIYDDRFDETFTMRLATWEQLPDYEKFKMMLKGAKEDSIVKWLEDKAIPFMKNRGHPPSLNTDETMKYTDSTNLEQKETFIVRWLKEVSTENQLTICSAVFDNQFGDSPIDGLFEDKTVAIETALACIYLSSATDQWNTMAAILSKLPRTRSRDHSLDSDRIFTPRHAKQGLATTKRSYVPYQHGSSMSETSRQNKPLEFRGNAGYSDSDPYNDDLDKRIQVAEGHVEVGRLLAFYQVPKPIAFFLTAHADEKNVKQLIRLILSKFGRRQPSRSDTDWACMWHDIQCIQEKAFPFLNLEYMLIEFIRGLLKAGKFSLARNYLKGTGSISLAVEKAENLVIQAAREYFFSASSLSCSEIWKAKECLSIFPNSKNVKAESDIIDALTVRLPNLGVNVLPMQFRQIRNPMEIINMVITNHTGAYLNVEELIEIAKLLGLNSQDDISAIEESVAREAAVTGDMQLAFDLCLVLARKGHGPIWDLCAAIARGPDLDNMDMDSRKYLLGFSLSHCDDESAGELLNAWKEIDLRSQSEQLLVSTKNMSKDRPTEYKQYINNENDVNYDKIKVMLSRVAADLPSIDGLSWESILKDNKKALGFAMQYLPHLFELCVKKKVDELPIAGSEGPAKNLASVRAQALSSIIYWLAGVNIPPSDNLVGSLVKSIMEPPLSERDVVLGCAFLLNLVDSFHGVEVIEEQLKGTEAYEEVYSIMNIGMIYSSLNNAQKECSNPEERRNILLQNFHDKHVSLSEDNEKISQLEPTFWREWKRKLEEQKRLADQARQLEQIIPGIEASRFLSGEAEYVKTAVFSFIDSVKFEKRHILKQAVILADTYGLQRIEVLLKFLGCALSSEQWSNEDILSEILEFRDDIIRSAKGVIDMVSSVVYPQIDGQNKERLSYIYSILAACFLHLQRNEDPALMEYIEEGHTHILEPSQYYKVLDQECRRVSFIKKLNFKNIAGLDDLNFEHFNEEICNNIHKDTVEALASMVQSLVCIYNDYQAKGLISMRGVYRHHVLGLLAFLEGRNEARSHSINADELLLLIKEIEQTFDSCSKYIRVLPETDIAYITGKYCSLCFPSNFSRSELEEPAWKECLLVLLNFWIKLIHDIPEETSSETPIQKPVSLERKNILRCLNIFRRLLKEDEISASQGWSTISNYVKFGLVDGLSNDISSFLTAMIFSSCPFESIAETCYGEELPLESFGPDGCVNLPQLYLNLTDTLLSEGSQESSERSFHNLLSSLSKLAGNFREDLKAIRSKVWEKLSAFSQDSDVSSYTRMHTLQLMQSITGIGHKGPTTEFDSELKPWEAWNEFSCSVAAKNAEGADIPITISTNLVALKSTQLLSGILPNCKIDSEQLMTLDSAVSCFLNLCETVTSAENTYALRTVLEVWEELFSNRTDKEKKIESPKELNWSSDEWDEGWETLPEELVDTAIKQEGGPASICALHSCWTEIIRRLVGYSRPDLVLELLDQSSSKSHAVLLDEDETQSLYQFVLEKDCFLALKILLLLPYQSPRSQCLSVVESRLQDAVSGASSVVDYELLVLLLSSGMMSEIASDPSYSKVLAYVCYSIGFLSRNYQESLLKFWKGEKNGVGQSSIFAKVLLPFFICELVCGGQPLLAGCIITKCMHTHPSLGILDVMEASLVRYLEVQVHQLQPTDGDESVLSDVESSGSLAYSVSFLKSQLENKLKSAVTQLSKNLTRSL